MKLRNTLVLLILIQGLAGCAFLQSFSPASPEHIQTLIDREQYTRALQAIDNIPDSHKNYEQLVQKKKTK